MTNTTHPDHLLNGYPDAMSACTAFAEAMNSGETKAFLAKLDPAVKYISKWACHYGADDVADFLRKFYFTERERKKTSFVGVLVSSKGMPLCTYSLETIHRPSYVLMFSLSDAGMVQSIFNYPGHYLRHRDGRLTDVLD